MATGTKIWPLDSGLSQVNEPDDWFGDESDEWEAMQESHFAEVQRHIGGGEAQKGKKGVKWGGTDGFGCAARARAGKEREG